MFKKYAHKLDIVDALWDEISDSAIETTLETTWEEYTRAVCEKAKLHINPSSENWIYDDAVKTWLWETDFLYTKPVRDMKYFYGEHALLYDVYGCEKHRVLVTTYDDYRIVWNSTVICPVCNAEKFRIVEPKPYPLRWEVVEDKEYWDVHLWRKNLHKKRTRESNIRHWKKNPRNFLEYLKYKMTH